MFCKTGSGDGDESSWKHCFGFLCKLQCKHFSSVCKDPCRCKRGEEDGADDLDALARGIGISAPIAGGPMADMVERGGTDGRTQFVDLTGDDDTSEDDAASAKMMNGVLAAYDREMKPDAINDAFNNLAKQPGANQSPQVDQAAGAKATSSTVQPPAGSVPASQSTAATAAAFESPDISPKTTTAAQVNPPEQPSMGLSSGGEPARVKSPKNDEAAKQNVEQSSTTGVEGTAMGSHNGESAAEALASDKEARPDQEAMQTLQKLG